MTTPSKKSMEEAKIILSAIFGQYGFPLKSWEDEKLNIIAKYIDQARAEERAKCISIAEHDAVLGLGKQPLLNTQAWEQGVTDCRASIVRHIKNIVSIESFDCTRKES